MIKIRVIIILKESNEIFLISIKAESELQPINQAISWNPQEVTP